MKTINPKEVPAAELHGYLLGAIAPRPIAFASTVDKEGNVNLSPFSYFNVFGTNPATLIFSPSRRVRGNTNKHTLENVLEVKEVVINMVNFSMVEQMSLASTEYDKGVNEFLKSGFTPVDSIMVRPPRVKESPASFECLVKDIIETGKEGGAGNLIICEVVLVHLAENILDEENRVDPYKLDAVARMGCDFYCRAQGEAIFKIPKPTRNHGMGIDNLPAYILNSSILTGNNLARLAGMERIPTDHDIQMFKQELLYKEIEEQRVKDPQNFEISTHQCAKKLIERGEVKTAWLILLALKD